MKSKHIFFTVVLVTIILILIHQLLTKLGYLPSTELKENFVTQTDYLYAESRKYPPTIYETSLRETFVDYRRLYCNLVPVSTRGECSDVNGNILPRDRIPVHIIKEFKEGKYLAVFNDGKIYSKKNINEKFWKGPIAHSLIERTIPLRMITLSNTGKRLIGVGYDNNIYIKKEDDYKSTWQLVPNSENIIYILYDSDRRLIGINTEGFIVKKDTEQLESNFSPIESEEVKMLKLYWDKNGYLLGLGTDFKIYKKESQNWIESVWDMEKGANQIPVNDIIYDIDARLYGLVLLPQLGTLELMKQTETYYLSPFEPLEFQTPAENRLITDTDIIKYKTGYDFASETVEEEDEDPFSSVSLNAIYQKQMIDDKKKLYDFCVKKGHIGAVPYSNFELQNKINEQDNKIEQINKDIIKMVQMDPERLRLQELDVSLL